MSDDSLKITDMLGTSGGTSAYALSAANSATYWTPVSEPCDGFTSAPAATSDTSTPSSSFVAVQGGESCFAGIVTITALGMPEGVIAGSAQLISSSIPITMDQLPPMPVPVIPETDISMDAMQNPDGGIFSNGTPY